MSSSTSSSDAVASAIWERCIAAFLAALGGGALLVLALMVAIDPYDSGRFGLLGIKGTGDSWTPTGQVSRARDPDFDSAVIGNSTAQLIRPDTLSAATGSRFVQLFVSGAPPQAQLAVLGFFLRHHAKPRALVVVIDDPWCAHQDAIAANDTFPYWLYDGSALRYTAHLFNWRAIDLAIRRIKIWRGLRAPERPDGYSDYEIDYPPGTQAPADVPQPPAPRDDEAISTSFPLAERLNRLIRGVPAETSVVLVVPPNFHTILPTPGSRAAREREACNAAFRQLVSGRAHSNLIDFRVDNALTRNPANFLDHIHYRSAIARRVNDGIIASIRDGAAARIDF
ncbi:hypothetical protein [Bradyrhizobium sp. HKCCYLR20261]|uniref:hypothetical protein n=1 Tax=unclassified Bradyrhizobium TaxID=2631580 RepID=UPI003EB6F26E